MAMGRARALTMAWTFVVRPPRERPIACACAPLFARRRAVGLGRRTVDGLTTDRIGGRQRFNQATLDPAHRPAAKAIVDCRRRPVDGRAIQPATASFQNVNDAADQPSAAFDQGLGHRELSTRVPKGFRPAGRCRGPARVRGEGIGTRCGRSHSACGHQANVARSPSALRRAIDSANSWRGVILSAAG